MLFLLNLFKAKCSLDKELMPSQTSVFVEFLTEEDEQLTLNLVNISKKPGIRYTIDTPGEKNKKIYKNDFDSESNEESEYDGFGLSLDEMEPLKKTYVEKGKYVLQIRNTTTHPLKYTISSYVSKKLNKVDESVVELRNLLQTLRGVMDNLRSENYHLNLIQKKNIKEARAIKVMLNLLILFPLVTIGIGYLKNMMVKQMVKPKNKNVHNIFN